MDALFKPTAVALHQQVVNHLISSFGVHSILPLLGVSRHWRSLAIKALLKPFTRTKPQSQKGIKIKDPWFPSFTAADIGKGDYIKVALTGYCPQEGAHKNDDPRYYLKNARPSIYLLFKSFDPKTCICTFAPPGRYKNINYFLHCAESGKILRDIPCTFEIVSSAWFRPSSGPNSLYGLALAGRKDRFPVCEPPLCPRASDEENGQHEEKDAKLPGGWTISYETVRDDRPGHGRDRGGIMKDVETKLIVKELKLPLIDLFCPRHTGAEKEYYDDDY